MSGLVARTGTIQSSLSPSACDRVLGEIPNPREVKINESAILVYSSLFIENAFFYLKKTVAAGYAGEKAFKKCRRRNVKFKMTTVHIKPNKEHVMFRCEMLTVAIAARSSPPTHRARKKVQLLEK